MKKNNIKEDFRLKNLPDNAVATKLICYMHDKASKKYVELSYNDLAKHFKTNKSNICRIIRYMLKLNIISKKKYKTGKISMPNKYKFLGV